MKIRAESICELHSKSFVSNFWGAVQFRHSLDALGIDREGSRETRLSEPFRSRHQARLTIARRRCRNAFN